MDTKLKGVWGKIKDFFKNMSTKVRIILGVVLVLIVAAVAAVALWSSNQPYDTLFTGLTTEEASSVLSYLDENGLKDYQYTGDTILVRADQRQVLLAQLAMAGYPKTGSLYGTYFERTGTMSTTSERATAEMVSIMEDLSAIVRTFEGVQDAQVRIDLGEDRTYVLEDISTETTASVKLTLRDGYVLPDKTAEAIRGLIAHSIAGLDIDSVFVTDTLGNTYSGDSLGDRQDSSALKLKIQEAYNNQIRTNVMQVLARLYGGTDNVQVAVNTTVDVDKRFVENTNYTQPEGSYENGGLIGQEHLLYYITREGLEPVGGVVGTESNADLSTYVEDLLQGAGDGDTAGQVIDRDNKINESHEQVEAVAYTVTNVTVAVTINERANPDAAVDIVTLQSHVATASGIGGDNPEQYVSVLVAPFLQEELTPGEGALTEDMVPYLIIAGAAALLLIVLLVVILSVRRKKRRQEQAEEEARAEELRAIAEAEGIPESELGGLTPEMAAAVVAAAPPTGGADIMDINTEKSMELRKTVRQFVQNNPEVAAQLLKAWLKGGEDENG